MVPGDTVHRHLGLPETLATRIRRFDVGLAELSQRTGISVIDVDAVLARTGAMRAKLDALHFTAEGCRTVAEEIVRVLDDLGCLVHGRGTAMRMSVVVRSKNEADRLRLTLASLAQQTLPAEVVVVNDGSTDHTADVLAEAARDMPLSIVTHAAPRGRSGASNAGSHAATGDVLLFIDGDTLAAPDWVAQHAAVPCGRTAPRRTRRALPPAQHAFPARSGRRHAAPRRGSAPRPHGA